MYSTLSSSELDQLNEKIKQKGDEIRQLKDNGSTKEELAPHVAELLGLKAQLPTLDAVNGDTMKPESATTNNKTKKPKTEPKEKGNSKKPASMVEALSESEIRNNRLAKIEAMKTSGVEPFEYSFASTHTAAQLAKLYDGRLSNGEEDAEASVAVAGRIMTRRVFGKLAFFTLQDETGTVQLQFDQSRLDASFQVRFVIFGTDLCKALCYVIFSR